MELKSDIVTYICFFFLFQSLVEKHFPAPDRDKINRILGIGKQKTILDELGKKTTELPIIHFPVGFYIPIIFSNGHLISFNVFKLQKLLLKSVHFEKTVAQ